MKKIVEYLTYVFTPGVGNENPATGDQFTIDSCEVLPLEKFLEQNFELKDKSGSVIVVELEGQRYSIYVESIQQGVSAEGRQDSSGGNGQNPKEFRLTDSLELGDGG